MCMYVYVCVLFSSVFVRGWLNVCVLYLPILLAVAVCIVCDALMKTVFSLSLSFHCRRRFSVAAQNNDPLVLKKRERERRSWPIKPYNMKLKRPVNRSLAQSRTHTHIYVYIYNPLYIHSVGVMITEKSSCL